MRSDKKRSIFLPKCENRTPRPETARKRPRPPPAESGEANTIRHDEETAGREVDLIARKLENGPETWSSS